MRITAILVFALVALLLTSSVAFAAGDGAAGKEVFLKKCKACHGADGTPNPAIAKKGAHALSGPEVQGLKDPDLAKKIKETASHKALVKSLTDADVDNIVAFIRTLKK